MDRNAKVAALTEYFGKVRDILIELDEEMARLRAENDKSPDATTADEDKRILFENSLDAACDYLNDAQDAATNAFEALTNWDDG